MKKYDHKRIEGKWHKEWEKKKLYKISDKIRGKKNFYLLVEFPYPSGNLHVGHWYAFSVPDILARTLRMQGKNVLFPIGFDAFGLPAENAAIKNKLNPRKWTYGNIAHMREQMRSMGTSFDWSREVVTCDPSYYKWTQWQFLQFFKAGLAYKAKTLINWCPKCKIGLANEEAAGGVCERCGTAVEKREKDQWMIGITKYADRLLADLDTVNYLPKIRKQQEEWIGRSEGAEIIFKLCDIAGQPDGTHSVTVFTTRPDTLFGATFLAIAPELAKKWIDIGWQASTGVREYVASEMATRDAARDFAEKEKTGVAAGITAVNPATGEKIPVWIVNYVLGDVGTGAIMAVPAHDERDFEFAQKFGLEVKQVVSGSSNSACWPDDGVNINSEFLNGLTTPEAKQKMVAWLEENKCGARATTYKLRDWVFSRQRYWGEPIPLVHCETCATKKQKVLMIHGFEGSAELNFFPYIKNELEARGFEVFAPTMTTSHHPDVEKWMEELMPYMDQLGADDVVLGHSIGSKAALHLVERAGKKIKNLFLVASRVAAIGERDWAAFKKEWGGNPDVEALRKFWEVPMNLQRVNELAENVQLVWSDDDEWTPHVEHDVLPSGWFINRLHGHGHFDAEVIPELRDIILTAKITGWNPLPDSALPLTLPHVEKYEPTDTGESPLASIPEWVNTKCPRCGSAATRETDTMPNWAGSSWYFLRYLDAHNDTVFAAADKLKYWMPVDLYNGGMEHTVLHLLYSRFWNKFMYDCGYVPTPEPYARRVSHGLIMAEDGAKMSKSKGNVVNPDEIVQQQGADTLRVYEMFIGPFGEPAPWSTNGVVGVKRFLDRVMRLPTLIASEESEEVTRGLHKMLKAVTQDYDRMSFNTAIAHYMTFVNTVYGVGAITKESLKIFLAALNVAAPHVSEELWEQLGSKKLVCEQPWPQFDAAQTLDETFELVVQINGKVRDRIQAQTNATEDEIKTLALDSVRVSELLAGAVPKNVIVIPGRLINIVV